MTVPTACHPGPCAGVAVHGTRGVILSGRRREGSSDGTEYAVTPDLFRGHLTQFPPAYPHGSLPTAQIYWILQPLRAFRMTQPRAVSIAFRAVPPAFAHRSLPTAQIYWILQSLRAFRMTQPRAVSITLHSSRPRTLTAHNPNFLDPSTPCGLSG